MVPCLHRPGREEDLRHSSRMEECVRGTSRAPGTSWSGRSACCYAYRRSSCRRSSGGHSRRRYRHRGRDPRKDLARPNQGRVSSAGARLGRLSRQGRASLSGAGDLRQGHAPAAQVHRRDAETRQQPGGAQGGLPTIGRGSSRPFLQREGSHVLDHRKGLSQPGLSAIPEISARQGRDGDPQRKACCESGQNRGHCLPWHEPEFGQKHWKNRARHQAQQALQMRVGVLRRHGEPRHRHALCV